VRSIPWVLWNVWKNRNALLYAETQTSPSFWVLNAEEEATLWFEANKQAQHIEAQSHRIGDMERGALLQQVLLNVTFMSTGGVQP
ncbi:unnamed protein product, partial [Brassica oleracea var. botrytis]